MHAAVFRWRGWTVIQYLWRTKIRRRSTTRGSAWWDRTTENGIYRSEASGGRTADSTDVPSTLLRSRAKWSCCTWKVVASSQFINNGDARMYRTLVLLYHRDRLAVWSVNWLRGAVVERWSLTGKLSLSCARPAADGWPPFRWLNRPL